MIFRSLRAAHPSSKSCSQSTTSQNNNDRRTHLHTPLLLTPATLPTSQPALPRTLSSSSSRSSKNSRRFSVSIPQGCQPRCVTDTQWVSRGLSLRCVVPCESLLRDNSEELKRVSAEDLEGLRASTTGSSRTFVAAYCYPSPNLYSSNTRQRRGVSVIPSTVVRLRLPRYAVLSASPALSSVTNENRWRNS